MEPDKLFTKLKEFFPNQIDLMRHLHVNACWEYSITEQSTDDANIKLNFFLVKKNEKSLEMTKTKSDIKPDLILYFTEKAILNMIEGTSSAEEYYERYHNIMDQILILRFFFLETTIIATIANIVKPIKVMPKGIIRNFLIIIWSNSS